jgi:hypothetical protein
VPAQRDDQPAPAEAPPLDALGLPPSPDDSFDEIIAAGIAGRAIDDDQISSAAEARPVLVTARASYAGLHMTQRVEPIDALLAHLPR